MRCQRNEVLKLTFEITVIFYVIGSDCSQRTSSGDQQRIPTARIDADDWNVIFRCQEVECWTERCRTQRLLPLRIEETIDDSSQLAPLVQGHSHH